MPLRQSLVPLCAFNLLTLVIVCLPAFFYLFILLSFASLASFMNALEDACRELELAHMRSW